MGFCWGEVMILTTKMLYRTCLKAGMYRQYKSGHDLVNIQYVTQINVTHNHTSLNLICFLSSVHLFMHLFVTLDFNNKTCRQTRSLYNKNIEKLFFIFFQIFTPPSLLPSHSSLSLKTLRGCLSGKARGIRKESISESGEITPLSWVHYLIGSVINGRSQIHSAQRLLNKQPLFCKATQ